MKKILFSIFYFLFSIFLITGQNLVPNYSFESNTGCPNNPGQVNKAFPWYDPSNSSSDYFHGCSVNMAVPNNVFGFQSAKTGNGYTGLYTIIVPLLNAREYIQAPLLTSLLSGQKYCVLFYVNLADACKYGTDGIGAYFSSAPVNCSPGWCLLSYAPQVQNPTNNIITDTMNWVIVKGSFIANGGEKYITIGNFKDDANTNILFINSTTSQNTSYFFIDDVFLYAEQNADAGNDKTICKGDSIQIGTSSGYGLKYTWSTAVGLSDTTAAQPIVSPSQTTTYIITITDTIGANCIGKGSDTVTVYVKNVPTANAGSDSTICRGKNIQLGEPGAVGYSYKWSPATGLIEAAYAQPIASPVVTTKYKLTVSDTLGGVTCSSTDSMLVKVEDCTLQIPTILFYKEQLEIKNLPENSQLEIYNMLGQMVFTSNSYSNNSGVFFLSPGIYFYWLRFSNGEAEQGKFCVVK